MAAFQIETDTCHGRGFAGADPNGFLAKFYTWVTKAPGAGGPGWHILYDGSALATDPYIIVSDIAAPSHNDYDTGTTGGAPKIMRVGYQTTEAGYVRVEGGMGWDGGSGLYSRFFGYRLETYDDADFVYDFRGGDECMILQTRLGVDWDSVILDEFVGDANLLEDASVVGTVQSGVVAGASGVLQLDTGEAANFTEDNWYYIYDFDGHSWVNYVQATNVDTGSDQVTVANLEYDFPSGSVIGAYMHRLYATGHESLSSDYMSSRKGQIPYTSDDPTRAPQERVAWRDGERIYCGFAIDYAEMYLKQMAANDDGAYAVQRPGICEYYQHRESFTSPRGNRAYGVCKNLYLTRVGSMARGQDGRTINGKNWLYFQLSSDLFQYNDNSLLACLFLDTEATS